MRHANASNLGCRQLIRAEPTDIQRWVTQAVLCLRLLCDPTSNIAVEGQARLYGTHHKQTDCRTEQCGRHTLRFWKREERYEAICKTVRFLGSRTPEGTTHQMQSSSMNRHGRGGERGRERGRA
jgi:hypothetical protein